MFDVCIFVWYCIDELRKDKTDLWGVILYNFLDDRESIKDFDQTRLFLTQDLRHYIWPMFKLENWFGLQLTLLMYKFHMMAVYNSLHNLTEVFLGRILCLLWDSNPRPSLLSASSKGFASHRSISLLLWTGTVVSCCKPSSGAGVVWMNSRHRMLVWLPKPRRGGRHQASVLFYHSVTIPGRWNAYPYSPYNGR